MVQKTKTLGELAALVDGELLGESKTEISNLNDLGQAVAGEITFLAKVKFVDRIAQTEASAIIVPLDVTDISLPAIRVKNPYLAAAIIHNVFYERVSPPPGVHPRAHVGSDCRISDTASIAPLVVLGHRVSVGHNVIIEAGVVIGDDVEIGDDTVIEANAVVRSACNIGKRVTIYSGAVIGSDGFGYATDDNGVHIKRPQVGNVILEDDVEIGANTCVDRATFGATLIKRGSKIDNLVMIGHNVEIGQGCFVVSQAGMAGSSKLGNGVILAGQSGVGDHVEVGDRVMAAGRSGINSNVEPGQVVAGFPAIAYKEWLRAATAFSRIPKLLKDMRSLSKQVRELTAVVEKRRRSTNNE